MNSHANPEESDLVRRLRQEILLARRRIYEVGEATPLQRIEMEDGRELFVKREDLSPIKAYKWRGAYNRMAQLTEEELASGGVVTASAGNHAQGVALGARKLGLEATIYMPVSTPKMKQAAVAHHGGGNTRIELVGDTYDAASAAARQFAETSGRPYIHAYDDLAVMAGQGTMADEIVMSGEGTFDVAFLQVGGGGMAAAVATWLKFQFPGIRIVGVEGVDQASMAAAIAAGAPVELDRVDVFCDGTAVRKVGELTHAVCREVIDEWMTVTNDEVSAAIQFLWENLRCIPEPSGAMGVAAVLNAKKGGLLRDDERRILTVLCGANMDFELLATVARRAAIGAAQRRHLRIQIGERPGTMAKLLEDLPDWVNIADFQYGKTDCVKAAPVIGFDVSDSQFDELAQALESSDYRFDEVTSETDVSLRMIPYEAALFSHPRFISLDFHERPGALAEFLRAVSPHASLCYFNYLYSGERVGRALLGFEFSSLAESEAFVEALERAKDAYRSYDWVLESVQSRILGGS